MSLGNVARSLDVSDGKMAYTIFHLAGTKIVKTEIEADQVHILGSGTLFATSKPGDHSWNFMTPLASVLYIVKGWGAEIKTLKSFSPVERSGDNRPDQVGNV